jgi:hypothetical protein
MRLEHISNLHNPSSVYIGNSWIWLRVHKTAGTSMYDHYLRSHCINISKQKDQVDNWLSRIDEDQLKKQFIWSFVRNPYDRFLSAAAMFKIDPNHLADDFNYKREKANIIKRHTEPQHKFTHYNGHQIPDFIGKFENLENDWRTVLEKMNLPYCLLPVSNSSIHKDWREELTEKTKSFIRAFYYLDFKYFGYEQ